MKSPENKMQKSKLMLYILISLTLPVLLFYPWLIAGELQGEGVQGGTTDFIPGWLIPYTPMYEVNGEHHRIAVILNCAATFTTLLFYLSLINALLAIVIYIIHRIKKLLGKPSLTTQPREP